MINTLVFQKELKKKTVLSAQSGIYLGELGKININFPSDEKEQKQISALIDKLDIILDTIRENLSLYQKIKDALLQKVFASDGDLVPKVRFTDFHGDWEQHKLGDFLKIPQNEKIKIKSSNQLMTVKLNVGGIVDGGNRETLSLGSTTYYKRHMGQLIYGKQNFFNGSIAIVPATMDGKATSGDVPSFDISNSINSNFLFDVISRRDYWKSKEAYSTGTGSKRIHEQTFLNFDITVANSSTEQQKIVKIISSLNGLISALQIKLDRTVSLKKFMLQKLFI